MLPLQKSLIIKRPFVIDIGDAVRKEKIISVQRHDRRPLSPAFVLCSLQAFSNTTDCCRLLELHSHNRISACVFLCPLWKLRIFDVFLDAAIVETSSNQQFGKCGSFFCAPLKFTICFSIQSKGAGHRGNGGRAVAASVLVVRWQHRGDGTSLAIL